MAARRVIERLVTEIIADATKQKKGTQESIRDMDAWGKRVTRIAATVVGSLATGALFRKITEATRVQEKAEQQLLQGLKTTNNAVGQSFDELVKKAAELQKVTTFGDEEIIRAQSQLVTFTKIAGDQFDRTTEAALDLATRMDGDLKGAVLQLGKALNDPVANLSALSRAGIQFEKEQRELISTLFKTGREAEAQSLILDELEKQFGGSARAARNGIGAIDALKNAYGDLFELSDTSDFAEDINELTDLLQDPDTIKAAQALAGAIVSSFGAAADALVSTVNVTRYLGEEIAAAFSGIASDDTARLEAEITKIDNILNNNFLASLQDRIVLFGQGGIIEYWSEEELKAEKAKIEEALLRTYDEVGASIQNKSLIDFQSKKKTDAKSPDIAALAAEEKARAAREKFQADEAKRLAQLEKSAEGYTQNLQKQIALMDTKTELAKANFELEHGRFSEINENSKQAIRAEAQKLDALNAQREALEALKEVEEELLTPVERINQAHERRLEIIRNAVTDEGRVAELEAKSASLLEADLESLKEKAKDVQSELSVFAKRAAENMQDIFADFLFDPLENGFDDMVDNFGRALRRMAAEAAAAQIFEAIGGYGSNNSDSWIGQVAGLFAGAFDTGGIIPGGQFGLVGERGPELVSGPARVVSREQTAKMMGGDVNMTFNISAPNEQAGRKAAGQVAREVRGAMASFGRY